MGQDFLTHQHQAWIHKFLRPKHLNLNLKEVYNPTQIFLALLLSALLIPFVCIKGPKHKLKILLPWRWFCSRKNSKLCRDVNGFFGETKNLEIVSAYELMNTTTPIYSTYSLDTLNVRGPGHRFLVNRGEALKWKNYIHLNHTTRKKRFLSLLPSSAHCWSTLYELKWK